MKRRIVLLLSVVVGVDATCFDTFGNAMDSAFVPCDPSAKVTHCCSSADYCLSNGLCLNAGANNVMSQQGCTDQTWGSPPCRKYCTNHGNTAFPSS